MNFFADVTKGCQRGKSDVELSVFCVSEEEKDLEPALREFSKQFMAEFDYEAEARNMARAMGV